MSGLHHGEAAQPASLPARIAGALAWTCGALSTGLILLAFAITILAVFMRYVMNDALLWSDEVTGWTLVALVSLGVAEAYRRGDHIAIDLISARLSSRAAKVQRLFADAAVLIFAVVIFLSTWEAISFARMFGSYTSGYLEIESWIPQAPMMIAAIMLALVALSRMFDTLTGRSR